MPASVNVLVVDDDKAIRALLVRLLELSGVTSIVEATNGDEGISAFADGAFDLVLVDWDMPGRDGLAVVEEIHQQDPNVHIIMISAKDQKEAVLKVVQAGASGYILKPFDPKTVRDKLGALCENIGLRNRNADYVCGNVMTSNVITVSEDTTARQAIEKLLEYKISGLPVVDQEEKLVGLITEYQLVQALFRPELQIEPVSRFMTTDLITVDEDALLFEVANLMLKNRMRRIPVTRNGRVVGIIARRDLLRYFLEHEADLADFIRSIKTARAEEPVAVG